MSGNRLSGSNPDLSASLEAPSPSMNTSVLGGGGFNSLAWHPLAVLGQSSRTLSCAFLTSAHESNPTGDAACPVRRCGLLIARRVVKSGLSKISSETSSKWTNQTLEIPDIDTPPALQGRAGIAAAAAALMPPNVRRALQKHPQQRVVARHQARRPADAGKPLVRSLLRHDGRRARIRRSGRAEAARRAVRILPARRRRIPTDICCRSIWTRTRPARRRFLPPATPGRCSTKPGTAAKWTTGCRRTARPMA